MKYQVKKVAGWKSTLFSGEGLVAELSGPGKLTLQSRQPGFLLVVVDPQAACSTVIR